ncbi:MAG: hypothetical protein K6A91_06380 [Clostridia bacterium]|nr:hypothetical protein [Clostridia bacterium]
MKDDLLILNTLGRRRLPRLLPVIILGAAAITLVVISHGSLIFRIGRVEYGDVVYHRFSRSAGYWLRWLLCLELFWAAVVLRGPFSKRSKCRYTIGMLRVSERRIFLLCCLFNVLVYLLIWASLCCAAVIIGKTLNAAGAFGTSPQALYAEYMLDGYMQQFVPMDNVPVTVSMILFMVSMGLLSARDFAVNMKGKPGALQLFAVLIFMWTGAAFGAGVHIVGWLVLSAIMFMLAVGSVWFSMMDLSRGTNVEVDDGE